jgi:hypothetical protein
MALAFGYIAPLSGDKPWTCKSDNESCLGVVCESEMLEF